MHKRTSWIRYGVLAAAFIVAVTYLFVSGMTGSMVYYLTLEELSAAPPRAGQEVRLAGWVKKGSVTGSPLDGEVLFTMTDGTRELPVRYTGQVPDTFEPGVEVIVEGPYQDRPVFEASTLLARCPSKYQADGPPPGKKDPL